MQLFEITLLLLSVAVVMLQVGRHLRIPYPSLLALAGGCVALLPFAPHLRIEPQLALALFVAPAVMSTAFDMPPRELARIWLPLVSLAVVLVLLTTAAVAWAAMVLAGLPMAAAIALGAIVAPPDAAAASAVLGEFNLPRRTMAVLQGEGLLNDAVALLAFGLAVSAATSPNGSWESLAPRLLVAVPGAALLGVIVGLLGTRILQKAAGTLSLIIIQFLLTWGTWILAARLELSPIVAVVALAAVIAKYMPARTSARDRVNANVVWAIMVFILNVLAFLLMGLQARIILDQLKGAALLHALVFSAIVLGLVIGVRFAWVLLYGVGLRLFRSVLEYRVLQGTIPKVQIGVLVSWCGMRGLVTLATALALPQEFPGRDVIVLSAFVVVLGTLILQGFTIRPLIKVLRIAPDSSLDEDVATTRSAMLDAALVELQNCSAEGADVVRAEYSAARTLSIDRARPTTRFDSLRMRGIAAQRRLLIEWRRENRIYDDAYHILEDELDRAELQAAPSETSPTEG
jgi:Na+/H+ antiporter